MTESSIHPGKLYLKRIYQIECALCDAADYDGFRTMTREDAQRTFTYFGWRRIRGLGWIYPECAKEKMSFYIMRKRYLERREQARARLRGDMR